MERDAFVTPCGRFRTWLTRRWAHGGKTLLWVMLNPSTADADNDDQTLLKCVAISQHNGFNALCVVNLYDYRATEIRELKKAGYPRSAAWLATIRQKLLESDSTVVAWGASAVPYHAAYMIQYLSDFRPVYRVALTKSGQPGHPLYLPTKTALVLHGSETRPQAR